jgi:hypothetical protein
MSTKSREVIWGGRIMGAKLRAETAIAFNTLEHLSDDVSAHIPAEVQTRFDIAGVPVPERLNDIVKSQLPPTRSTRALNGN